MNNGCRVHEFPVVTFDRDVWSLSLVSLGPKLSALVSEANIVSADLRWPASNSLKTEAIQRKTKRGLAEQPDDHEEATYRV